MSNYHSNNEKLSIDSGKCYSTDKRLDGFVQGGDKVNRCECSHSSNDPNANVFLNSNSTLHNHAASGEVTETTNLQVVYSSSRSVRRCRSDASDDDHFQIVSRKKSKQLNNHDGGNIRPQHILLNHDTVIMNINVNSTNVSSSSSNLFNLNPGHQQQQLITTVSTRYALTRFTFNKISISHFKEDIIHHFKSNHDLNVEIANCRSSTFKCNTNEIDILLYVKDPTSFAFLLDHSKWSETIRGGKFKFLSVPSIPPQLSLIIKNVDLRLAFDDFSNGIQNLYPDVKNVIRMKNKFGNFIELVKLELSSSKTRDDLLNAKKIIINYIRYDVDEYLAPAKVLI